MKLVVALIKPFKLEEVKDPLARIGVAAADEQEEKVVATIVEAARTGTPGDGRGFVLPPEDVTRIDTAQHGPAAR